MEEEEKFVLNIPLLARYLNVDEKVVRLLIKEHKIPATKIGKKWVVLKRQVDEWLANECLKNLEKERDEETNLD